MSNRFKITTTITALVVTGAVTVLLYQSQSLFVLAPLGALVMLAVASHAVLQVTGGHPVTGPRRRVTVNVAEVSFGVLVVATLVLITLVDSRLGQG